MSEQQAKPVNWTAIAVAWLVLLTFRIQIEHTTEDLSDFGRVTLRVLASFVYAVLGIAATAFFTRRDK